VDDRRELDFHGFLLDKALSWRRVSLDVMGPEAKWVPQIKSLTAPSADNSKIAKQ
jgi:hypothetical protein